VLLVQEIHLVAQLVGGALESGHLSLQLVALRTDPGELLALRIDARLGVRLLL
jgi:hypothetical protein